MGGIIGDKMQKSILSSKSYFSNIAGSGMIKKEILMVLLLFIFLFVRNVMAADITVSAHIAGFISGDTWIIDRTGTQLISTENDITIEDSSGTNAGWVFSVHVDDFTETGINDPCVNAATLSVRVDVEDWLSMKLKDRNGTEIVSGDIPATSGIDIPAANYTVNSTVIGSGNMDVLSVQAGHGAGIYDFSMDYIISLDDWLPDGTDIISSVASGVFSNASPVKVNNALQKYQIFAGTYETTITYSVASNPP